MSKGIHFGSIIIIGNNLKQHEFVIMKNCLNYGLYTGWNKMLGLVEHTYNPSIWEAEAKGSQVKGQPGLYSETLSQKIVVIEKGKVNFTCTYGRRSMINVKRLQNSICSMVLFFCLKKCMFIIIYF
jgi:hypothetical protein